MQLFFLCNKRAVQLLWMNYCLTYYLPVCQAHYPGQAMVSDRRSHTVFRQIVLAMNLSDFFFAFFLMLSISPTSIPNTLLLPSFLLEEPVCFYVTITLGEQVTSQFSSCKDWVLWFQDYNCLTVFKLSSLSIFPPKKRCHKPVFLAELHSLLYKKSQILADQSISQVYLVILGPTD